MWDKAVIIAGALSLLPISCSRERQTIPVQEETLEYRAYKELWERFQEAHKVKGQEGLTARAEAYEAIGNHYLHLCEEQKKSTGTFDAPTYENALNCFNQSRNIAGERSSTLTGFARAELVKEEYFDAGILSQKALLLDEENVDARIIKILSLLARRTDWKAIQDIEWYLSSEQGSSPKAFYNEEFRNATITAYLSRGNREKAEEHARMLLNDHPESDLARRILKISEQKVPMEK